MTKTSFLATPRVSQDVNRRHGALTLPLRYLSSADAGWEGLDAEAFLEPQECECWLTPVLPAVSLVFFRGGSMRIEARHANGPWSSAFMHAGSASMRAAWDPPYKVRWRSATDTPTYTLHLHLSQALLLSAAEHLAGCDLTRFSVRERPRLHDPVLAEMGRALWRELECPSPVGALYANAAAHFLAAHLLRSYSSVGASMHEPPREGLSPRQLRRVVDFVRAHLSQDLSLDTLAQHTGFSAYHFARLFRRTTGESPHQYVLRQRIERAQELLEQPDLPLIEIACATGFAHQSHLTQQFKRQFGVTPSVYRRERAPRVSVSRPGRVTGP
jgi:AraC family transcriptional regulator